jgi:hypothetical protein
VLDALRWHLDPPLDLLVRVGPAVTLPTAFRQHSKQCIEFLLLDVRPEVLYVER